MAGTLWMASGGESLTIWERPSYEPQLKWRPHSGNISDIASSYDGLFLATASENADKICVLFEGQDKKNRIIVMAEQERQTHVCFNPCSCGQLASGGRDGVVNVWDVKTQRLRKTLHGHSRPITGTVFNCKGTHLASASASGEILVHNVTTSQRTACLKPPKPESVNSIRAHSKSQATLASVTDYGHCHLWDMHRPYPTHTFSALHSAPAKGLAFSPINEILMVSCGLDKTVNFLDLRTKKTIKQICLREPLVSTDLLANGVTLALGSACGNVFVFDLRNLEEPCRTLEDGHEKWVNAVRFQGAARVADEGVRKEVTDRGSVLISEAQHVDLGSLEPQKACGVVGRFTIKHEVFSPLDVVGDGCPFDVPAAVTPVTNTKGCFAYPQPKYNVGVFSPLESCDDEVFCQTPDETNDMVANHDCSGGVTIEGPYMEPYRIDLSAITIERRDCATQVDEPRCEKVSEGTQTEAPAAKAMVAWDVQAMRALVRDTVQEARDETRDLSMDLRVDMARFFVELQLEIERMLRRDSLNEDLAERIVAVMEENDRLRGQLGLARRPR